MSYSVRRAEVRKLKATAMLRPVISLLAAGAQHVDDYDMQHAVQRRGIVHSIIFRSLGQP